MSKISKLSSVSAGRSQFSAITGGILMNRDIFT